MRRENGQIERMTRCIIPILVKLSISNPAEWHKYVDKTQQVLNSSFNRSIGKTPFELLISTQRTLVNDTKLKELIELEIAEEFDEDRTIMREEARKSLERVC